MGPDRSAQPAGRPRHQLHIPQRPAALHRPRRRASGAATQSDRRLRRRLDVPDRRNSRGAVGAAELRQGPGGRRGDDRRLQHLDGDDVGDARGRPVVRRARHQHAGQRGAVLRHLRVRRRPLHGGRVDRAAVLRRAAQGARSGRRRPAGAAGRQPLARAAGPVRRGVRVGRSRPLGEGVRRQRRLRDPGVVVRRGGVGIAHHRTRHVLPRRRGVAAVTRAAVLPQRAVDPEAVGRAGNRHRNRLRDWK